MSEDIKPKSSWRVRVPAVETPPLEDYRDMTGEQRLTTYTAGDPLCGYKGTEWHAELLKEEFMSPEADRGTEAIIVRAAGQVVVAAERILEQAQHPAL